jgi:hypothetical protein
MKKKLIIAQSINDISKLNEFYSEDDDILAITQDVMFVLDEIKLDYMVIEDFYNEKLYIEDIRKLNKDIDIFLSKLDKVCESDLSFSYAYSGNEAYLLTWLNDLIYLEKLVEVIQSKYQEIYLLAEDLPKKLSNKLLTISKLNSYKVNGTISLPFERSIERKIQIIFNSINIIFIKDIKLKNEKISTISKIKFFLNRVREYIEIRIKIQTNINKADISTKKSNVYVVQDGYEVFYLKKYLPKYNYLSPITKLRVDSQSSIPHKVQVSDIDSLLEEFIVNNFKYLGNYIKLIFHSYHIEIVGRIKDFKEKLEHEINIDKPNSMLFSIGSRDVFDTIIGFVANNYSIPVFFFQHGGHSEFSFNPYQKSLENNPRIIKNLIIQSKNEQQYLKHFESKVVVFGSIAQYEMFTYQSKKKPSKDILFYLSPSVNLGFRQLLNYCSSGKQYRASCDVLSVISRLLITADIKPHPQDEKERSFLLRKIIDKNQYKNINLIYGNYGELEAKKYQIIIIDFLGSALLSHILTLNICVVIYHQNFENLVINEDVKNDLKERCYIAKNKEELEFILIEYGNGNLPTKWSNYFLDKYIFPTNNISPGKEIANYINSIT